MTKYLHQPKNPNNCFTGQKPNEKTLLYIRKHWIVDVIIILKALFWLVLPFSLYGLAKYYSPDVLDDVQWAIIYLAIHFYAMFVLAWYFIAWLDIHLDLIIVTDQRLVDVNQTRIFHRKMAETSLSQIQDVSGQIKGFLGYVLNYGRLKILTASAENDVFEMAYVHKVPLVTSKILEIRDEFLKNEKREHFEIQEQYNKEQEETSKPTSVE